MANYPKRKEAAPPPNMAAYNAAYEERERELERVKQENEKRHRGANKVIAFLAARGYSVSECKDILAIAQKKFPRRVAEAVDKLDLAKLFEENL